MTIAMRVAIRIVLKAASLPTVPVPRYEWIVLQGGFRHFETKYKKTEFMISSNRGWGNAALTSPADFTIKYFTMLDRTSSDSDYTATDNIVHALYLGYQSTVNWSALLSVISTISTISTSRKFRATPTTALVGSSRRRKPNFALNMAPALRMSKKVCD